MLASIKNKQGDLVNYCSQNSNSIDYQNDYYSSSSLYSIAFEIQNELLVEYRVLPSDEITIVDSEIKATAYKRA